ncbi:MAG: DUF1501 domain-containing protein [Candidatus Methylacidiphilales bacterium]|nr:DUF1501 domain-containing protein [Candidatus Methylacidiphilales bacterium]
MSLTSRIKSSGNPPGLSRRHFLGQAACAGISCTPVFSTLLNLALAGNAAAQSSNLPGYRAIVCLFLGGGNDSFNMLCPRSGEAHAAYAASRQGLAHPMDKLLPLGPAGDHHPELGLHPAMPELKALFDAGRAAFIANVGSLVRPVTLAEYKTKTSLPLGLYSHSDQSEQWMTALPNRRSDNGWGGRASDLLRGLNPDAKISMNISLSGINTFQSTRQSFQYCITPNGSVGMKSLESKGARPGESAAVRSLLDQQYKSLFEQTYVETTENAIEAHQRFSAAVNPVKMNTVFPDTRTGRDLRMVARAIGAHSALGLRRQTFFVNRGGWDHHNEVIVNQNTMLGEVSAALAAFMTAMDELGTANDVVLFTASDFGRTLTWNGRGSDHGWGGNQLVLGGPVKGGKIYGRYPSLALKSDVDAGQGRLIPTLSVDQYSAELALWLGVSPRDLSTVLPNIGAFHDPLSGQPPLGFLL